MMGRGGAQVRLAGFRRAEPPQTVAGIVPHDLGKTADGALVQRALAVLRNVVVPGEAQSAMADADILVARNLESLAIAHRIAGSRPVIYECLDIHRSLLSKSSAGRLIRKIEASLLAKTKAIITSSPGFIREYFDHRPTGDAEIRLIENKILLASGEDSSAIHAKPKSDGPPWVIGWFGMLRYERTLAELADLAASFDGAIKVHIAGKPPPAELPDFAARVEASPHCHFSGPYSPSDLPDMYAKCHFAWAIDWFEEGQNSEWLLPNRLYEATAYATVPIVLRRHEVGRWLAQKNAGLQIVETSELKEFFKDLDSAGYNRLQSNVSAIEDHAIMMGDTQCNEFVSWLEGMA